METIILQLLIQGEATEIYSAKNYSPNDYLKLTSSIRVQNNLKIYVKEKHLLKACVRYFLRNFYFFTN